jgi:hypothetical protein
VPVDTITQVYAVQHCEIAPVTADAAGAAVAYGTWVDVPGIKKIEITGTMTKKTLRGDNRLITQRAALDELTCTFDHAKLSLDVLVVMLGGAVTQSGTTPDMSANWSLLKTAVPLQFGLKGISASSDSPTGAVRFRLPVCTLSKYPDMGFAEEDFRIVSAEMGILPPNGTDEWVDVSILETYDPPAPWEPEDAGVTARARSNGEDRSAA